jgi:hypothetical protein
MDDLSVERCRNSGLRPYQSYINIIIMEYIIYATESCGGGIALSFVPQVTWTPRSTGLEDIYCATSWKFRHPSRRTHVILRVLATYKGLVEKPGQGVSHTQC